MSDKSELEKLLPHRGEMLLIDSASVKEGTARAVKTITGGEWFLKGHFPDNPVVPGVILCEILAQSTCVLLAEQMQKPHTPYFTGLDKVRFKNSVRPGDIFETECRIIKHKHPFYWASGKGYVKGKLCVSAEFSFALLQSEVNS
jgi:3-hydroxyacyl-[acyl-carrier-protein] dehydratase